MELFEWTGVAVMRADMLEQQVSNLTSRYRLAEDTIHKLNEHLEDLMQAKTQHETQLVTNFAQLLNERAQDSQSATPSGISDSRPN